MADGTTPIPDQTGLLTSMNSILERQVDVLNQVNQRLDEQFQFQIRNNSAVEDGVGQLNNQGKSMSTLLGIQTDMILATDKLNTLYTRSDAMLKRQNKNITSFGAVARVIGADMFVMFDNAVKQNKLIAGFSGLTVSIGRDMISVLRREKALTEKIYELRAEGKEKEAEALERQKSLTLAVGFASMLGTQLKGLYNLFTGLLQLAKKFFTYTFDAFKTLMSLPIKFFDFASSIGHTIRSEIVETIGNAIENTKEFFDATDGIGKNFDKIRNPISNSTSLLLEFKNVSSDLVKTFGFGAEGLASAIQETQETINGLGPLSNVFGSIINKNIESMIFFRKAQKAMSLSTEDFAFFANEAFASGESLAQMFIDLNQNITKFAKSFSLDRKQFSKEFMILRKDIINFGKLSSEEIMGITGRMNQLGISTKEAQAIFGKLDTFESASVMAANLSQAFGVTMDAYSMIVEEDPSVIIQNLRDSLFQTGKSFQTMGRHERALLQQYTGMSAEAMNVVFNFNNASMSYEELQKRMEDTTPQQRQIDAIKAVTGSIKELQKIVENKSFFASFKDGITEVIKNNTELGASFIKSSELSQDFFTSMLNLGNENGFKDALNSLLNPVTKIFETINNSFRAGDFKNIINESIMSMAFIIDRTIGENKKNLRNSFKEIGHEIDNLFGKANYRIDESVKDVLKPFDEVGKKVGDVIRIVGTLGPQLIIKINEFFQSSKVGESPFAQFLGLTQADINDMSTNFGDAFNRVLSPEDGLIGKGMTLFKNGMIEVVTTVADIFISIVATGLNDIIQDNFFLRNFLPGADALKRRAAFNRARDEYDTKIPNSFNLNQLISDLKNNRGEFQKTEALGLADRLLEEAAKTENNTDSLQAIKELRESTSGNYSLQEQQLNTLEQILNNNNAINSRIKTGEPVEESIKDKILDSGAIETIATLGSAALAFFTYGASIPLTLALGTGFGVASSNMVAANKSAAQQYNDAKVARLTHPNGKISEFSSEDSFLAYRDGDVIHRAFSRVASNTEDLKLMVNNANLSHVREIEEFNKTLKSSIEMSNRRASERASAEERPINIEMKPGDVILDGVVVGKMLAANPRFLANLTDPRNPVRLSGASVIDSSFAPTDATIL